MSEIFGEWILEADAARQADESPRTWHRRRQNRTGPPYVKIGGRVYYRKDAIRQWLLDQEVQPVCSPVSNRGAA
ncbi:helix-turn-helix transcriptional regulator [Fodinicurvata fenggangensis]|uniref:helix-turn-helix transcriptional regulator n=1 Tax=Fodinicurvata fenggangensis TaxID=1121830 RepID=UPI000690A644|nr:helix-turn-helix domain-containing protein [Fodinicurvata fenggangensis]